MNPLSGVLGEAWTLYKRHAAHFLLISFAIYLVIAHHHRAAEPGARFLRRRPRRPAEPARHLPAAGGPGQGRAGRPRRADRPRPGRDHQRGAAVPGQRHHRRDLRQHRHRGRVRADHRARADPADVLVADRAGDRGRRRQRLRVVRPELADGPRLRVARLRHLRPGLRDHDRRPVRGRADPARAAVRGQELHRRLRGRHPGRPVPGRGGDAGVRPAQGCARRSQARAGHGAGHAAGRRVRPVRRRR